MKKNYIKVLLGTIACWLFCSSVFAQPLRNEFSVYVGGGPSPLHYKSLVGEKRTGMQGLVGIGYTWFPTGNFGVTSGVELGYYKSTLSFDSLNVSYPMIDPEDNNYEFRMKTNRYKEKQQSYFLQIPLMVQFQTSHETRKLYIAGGGKVAIHLQTDYKTNPSLMQNSGYYADEDYEYTSQTFMDFGTFSKEGQEGRLHISTGFLASLETGVRWQLPNDFGLYTGFYGDYGFNLKTNSILFSGYNQKNLSTLFETKRIPLTVGVKVKFAFGNGGNKKKRNRAIPLSEPDIKEPADAVVEENSVPVEKVPVDIPPVEKDVVETQPEYNDVDYNVVKEQIQSPVSGYMSSETTLSEDKKRDWEEKAALFLDLQKMYSDLQIVCEGYTDDTGSDLLNYQIGMMRAEAVKTYLVEKGIDAERITTVSKGKNDPLFSNDSEENRRKNRRVQLFINK